MKMRATLILLVSISLLSCAETAEVGPANAVTTRDAEVAKLKKVRNALVPFYQPMQVRPGDWLTSQTERGETFEEYIASDPTLPTADRRTIYIQPIGTFTSEQLDAIDLAAEYMRAYYNLPVKLRKERPLGAVPKGKQRMVDRDNRNRQIMTSYFIDDVLPGLMPEDAAALIAFTNFDLYPEPTWAFVFGQASLDKRVGVWSLYRFADPKTRKFEPAQLVTRTLKIAMHETGHMFSMRHCTKYECLMAGTNSVAETDRRPLDNCPECTAKLAWAMKYDPAERYTKLAAFWKKQGRGNEAKTLLDKKRAVDKVK